MASNRVIGGVETRGKKSETVRVLWLIGLNFANRLSEERLPNILSLAEALKKVGKKLSVTPGQVALAWLLAQGEDIIPIPGTSKVKVGESLEIYDPKISRLTN